MTRINPITENIDRSTDSGKAAIEAELSSAPIGSLPGDPRPGVSYGREAQAVYFARNLSGSVERKVLVEAASPVGVVSEALKKRFGLDAEVIKDRVNRGLGDFNIYETKVEPIDKVLFHDGKKYLIPCQRKDKSDNLVWPTKDPDGWVPIPEGVWDLQLGNYESMHGADQFAKRDEGAMLQGRWGGKPVCFEEGSKRKPESYIEMRREAIEANIIAVDREKVYAGSVGVEI